jgi:hypothetical protein
MKIKRLTLAILAALLLLPPAAYYGYYRFLRKEHFYRGLPTSHWEQTLKRASERIKRWQQEVYSEPNPIPYVDAVATYFGFTDWPSFLDLGDPAAIPVLLQLISSSDERIAGLAILSLTQSVSESREEIEQTSTDGRAHRIGNDILIRLPYRTGDFYSVPDGYSEYLLLLNSAGRYQDSLTFGITKKSGKFCGVFQPTLDTEDQLVVGRVVGKGETATSVADTTIAL